MLLKSYKKTPKKIIKRLKKGKTLQHRFEEILPEVSGRDDLFRCFQVAHIQEPKITSPRGGCRCTIRSKNLLFYRHYKET